MGVTLSYSGLGGKVKFSGTSGRFKTVYVQPAQPLLLDTYPDAAAAYSLRKLRTAYTGAAIRMRRTDNTETDIGFVNGVLDTSSISTFCGASEGFVTTWYDQSGIGVNAIQSTSAAQPKIFSSPNFYLENGKPSIKFTGATSCNLRRTGTMPLIERSFAFVGKQDFYQQDAGIFGFAPSGGGSDFNSTDTFIFQTANSSVPADYYVVGSTGASYFLPQNGAGTTAVLQYGLYLENKTTSVGEFYRNNVLIAQDSSFTQFDASNTQSLVLGGRQFNSSLLTGLFAGLFQEFVYWSVSNTANRLGIQNNINSFYSIY